MSDQTVVAGVGMIPFRKPGDHPPYFEMGAQAARLALADAGVEYAEVQQAFVGYVYGDSTSGQRPRVVSPSTSGAPVPRNRSTASL
jgi:sterol carrier protein 2